ncbi:hypothetical protein COV04_00650 [Candidatus Uhrbacteria bacterium CG10_big_fil_rev_8_21_14_0_10_48_11]|uniref:Trigger factor C-terminal domain-containing protein n=1 Tax=Candidatus Uhrbacteria bacterium CG10_big_fil_rev_8_21_14_0_10_48_11 TaxID=1975037 RepID=A0A2M8LFU4_9BACT|nr:MAG: hypothetical protein COV04_00650 [Candidatus Uhrbacteria bacterium CG10_big_fil_rev_8_21_14_0_10_48_11]
MPDKDKKEEPQFDEETRRHMHDVVLGWLQREEKKATAAVPTKKKKAAKEKPSSVPAPSEAKVEPKEKVVARFTPLKKPVVLDPSHELPSSHEQLLLLSGGRRLHKLAGRVYGGLVTVFFGSIVLAAALVYGFKQPHSTLAKILTDYVPLPYAFIGVHPIFYHTLHRETNALTFFYSQQFSAMATVPTSDDIKKLVETTVRRRLIAEALASRHNIWVTEKEVDASLEKVVEQAGSLEQVQNAMQQLWGWSIADYRRNVLRPYILKQKLLTSLEADPLAKRELPAGSTVQALDTYLDKLTPTMVNVVGTF